MTIREFAAAKVNLFLHVLGRRPDGYHDLDSLVVFASVGDEIMLTASPQTEISVTGPFADDVPGDDSNLAIRAVQQLGAALGRPDGVHVELVKNLPAAAGLGGGSADAAAVLRGLARLWETGPSMAFPAVAQSLGADVPVCLRSQAARITGIGEVVEPMVSAVPLHLVLVNCGVPVATPTVFAACTAYGAAAIDPESDDLTFWIRAGRNDLEASAISLVVEVRDTLSILRDQSGCLVARMSGSGATCFGLFDTADASRAARTAIADVHPDWWVVATDAH
jgi:4-diphosphocytidyl-2-C-methyl-D-erythritol kinase